MFEDLFETLLTFGILIAFALVVWAGITQRKVSEILSEVVEKLKEMETGGITEQVEEKTLI